jgi:hypothetical protein
MKTFVCAGLAALLAGGLAAGQAASAQADAAPPRFELALGTFLTRNDANIRLDSEVLGRGTELDFETDLNVNDDVSVFRTDAVFRFGDRQRPQPGRRL